MSFSEANRSNRLIRETSPYLLQHAHNPVDWYPWGIEAFQKAKQKDKPIFLSVGYSTCHWCHVMERECFEDQEVADKLNQSFISIKVDREERPDIDSIYMSVCQAMTGRGGWPLTIFMAPDQKPFYAGTYFPKRDRYGLPGFLTLIESIRAAWKDNKSTILESSHKISEQISGVGKKAKSPTGQKELGLVNASEPGFADFERQLVHDAFINLRQSYDSEFGGFGSSPKFPTPHNLLFLLRYWHAYKEPYALEMVEGTLKNMYRGGIFDHIGFGFSRYSTDHMWLVPHFEKMLYDNALLAMAYLEAYSATKKTEYSEVAQKIFEYVKRDMASDEGGFYSAEDADSEGEEGKFYVWTPDEIAEVLGEKDAGLFTRYYGISEKGNFEGKSIPNLIAAEIKESDKSYLDGLRKKLFEHRENRVHPYKDDKILTSWNGLMIAAFAMGGRILGSSEYTQIAEKATSFIFSKLINNDGRLLARYRDGDAAIPAYAEDYSNIIWGLIELFQASQKPDYLRKALQLSDDMIRLFRDSESGGFYLYGNDSEMLISRPKEIYDGAIPSGNSVAANNYIRLSRITHRDDLLEIASEIINVFSHEVEGYPAAYCHLMSAALLHTTPSTEAIIVRNGDVKTAGSMLDVLNSVYSPFTVATVIDKFKPEDYSMVPGLKDYSLVNGKTTAYVCSDFACREPVSDAASLEAQLKS